jgi:hypothetical protein
MKLSVIEIEWFAPSRRVYPGTKEALKRKGQILAPEGYWEAQDEV